MKLNAVSKWQIIAKKALKNNLANRNKDAIDVNTTQNEDGIEIKTEAANQILPTNDNQRDPKNDFNTLESSTRYKRPRLSTDEQTAKRRISNGGVREIKPKFKSRFDEKAHYPAADTKQVRCKLEGCTLKSVFYCMKCKVHLCIKKNNCFYHFHNLTVDDSE